MLLSDNTLVVVLATVLSIAAIITIVVIAWYVLCLKSTSLIIAAQQITQLHRMYSDFFEEIEISFSCLGLLLVK